MGSYDGWDLQSWRRFFLRLFTRGIACDYYHTVTQSLNTCPLGMDIEICRIDIEDRQLFRLRELGLRVHQHMRVMQKTSFGGCVLASGRERMALDGDTARRILVNAA